MTSAGSFIPNITTGSGADKILPEFVGKSNDSLLQNAKRRASRTGGGGGKVGSITKAITNKAEEITPGLNPGQQFIFTNYAVPAMVSAASPAEIDPTFYSANDIYQAGISSHEAAERALSNSIQECADAGAEAAEEAAGEGDSMLEVSAKTAATVLQVVETLGAFL